MGKIEDLERLQKLRDCGTLTEEELKKNKVLNEEQKN